MKVWIDLANSPHPLLFAPVARRLEADGATVMVTARDNAQTVELARPLWDRVEVIGEESPRGRVRKSAALLGRARGLARWALATRPDVALSHNSYAQLVVARTLGVPTVTAMDYEHQPANHVGFRAARTILLPEAIPLEAVASQGATASKVIHYPGLKEELYLGAAIGEDEWAEIVPPDDRKLVIVRTPPGRAAYHGFENPLFEQAVHAVAGQADVRCVILVRHAEQRTALERLGLPLTIPARAVDARPLIRRADVMIGAGGTMTREAALMGTPTYSVFAGRPARVDDYLISRGVLTRLSDAAQLESVERRTHPPVAVSELISRGSVIEEIFAKATSDAVA